MLINWNKYFNHIFVITRCSSFDRRKKLDSYFKEIGITNYQYIYNPDEDFSGNSKIFKANEIDITIGHQRTTFAHYMLWKICYELNYNKVLICEDDINFIDNQDILYNMLELYYQKSLINDIYMFDYLLSYNSEDFCRYFMGSCYAVNNYGLKYLIKKHEKYNLICDSYFFKFSDKIANDSNINSYTLNCYFNTTIIKMFFDKEDIAMKLDVSPISIAHQINKEY